MRDYFDTVLLANVPLAKRRVFPTRIFPLDGGKLPCLAVYTTSEASALQTMGRKTLARDVSIVVEAYIRASDTFDDDADAISVQIESAVSADTTLGGLAKDTVLISTEIEFSSEAERPIGVARLTFTVRYVTSIEDASTAR
tara:strand:- start:2653 stop:3075 length:423 start_codon:yes stop_codon:yes gene_type:complete